MFSVIITNRSMRDFVTSNTAEMLFDTLNECETYIESSEGYHPGRFLDSIIERPNPVFTRPIRARTDGKDKSRRALRGG